MKIKLASLILFGLISIYSVSITACDTKESNPDELNTSEFSRVKDEEQEAHGNLNANGLNGQHGKKGQDGGNGGNGENGRSSIWGRGGNGGNGENGRSSIWGRGGNGGNGGDAD